MNKLLQAEIIRITKSKSLKAGVLLMVVFAILICGYQYYLKTVFQYAITLDSTFYSSYLIAGILLAMFCSVHIGTEYHDGTIRNKLIVGHTRHTIYCTQYIISFLVAVLLNLVFHLTMLLLGIPLLGLFKSGMAQVMIMMLIGTLAMSSTAACLTCLALALPNRTYAALISTAGSFLLLVLAGYLYYRIQAPELIEPYSMTIGGIPQAAPKVPNPDYLIPVYRKIAQTVLDILPTGQAVQLMLTDIPNLLLLPVYSITLSLLVSISGIAFFQKKAIQ